jgi:uncharacterized membrane protein
MKKLYVFLLLFLLILPVAALAEGEIPTQPFSWEQLGTIAGAALATMLIVQLLKLPVDKVWKIPTRIIVFLIAAIVMTLATYFTQGITWETALLTLMNAVIAALTAMGAYEMTLAKIEQKNGK